MNPQLLKIVFPTAPKTAEVIAVALCANGESSYRDAAAIADVAKKHWGITARIISDKRFRPEVEFVTTKMELLDKLRSVHGTEILFTLSGHGFTTKLPGRSHLELNGKSEFVKVGSEALFDFELRDALFANIPRTSSLLCLIDTCHSGTMIDLENYTLDGRRFQRSLIPLIKRPFTVAISACTDNETAGEDVGDFNGWGGKLTCAFCNYIEKHGSLHVLPFYREIWRTFMGQRQQRSRPILGFSDIAGVSPDTNTAK